MKHFRTYHFVFGLIVFVVFLLTGQYMDIVHNHLEGMATTPRALYRAGHLYILLSSLVILAFGSYIQASHTYLLRLGQTVSSLLLAIAAGFLIASFFVELPTEELERPLSRTGLYLMLAGTLFHCILSRVEKRGHENIPHLK